MVVVSKDNKTEFWFVSFAFTSKTGEDKVNQYEDEYALSFSASRLHAKGTQYGPFVTRATVRYLTLHLLGL